MRSAPPRENGDARVLGRRLGTIDVPRAGPSIVASRPIISLDMIHTRQQKLTTLEAAERSGPGDGGNPSAKTPKRAYKNDSTQRKTLLEASFRRLAD
ncbi:uncharacterized protein BJX67DRAFT_353025 [Aspergillus lucknowensis]|uniref:BHLH domain-containing protein n=1 Tax=Aspergillus lucknowensis TaxID=176173 RepID=A0ABR4LS67_9EURO